MSAASHFKIAIKITIKNQQLLVISSRSSDSFPLNRRGRIVGGVDDGAVRATNFVGDQPGGWFQDLGKEFPKPHHTRTGLYRHESKLILNTHRVVSRIANGLAIEPEILSKGIFSNRV